MNSNDEDDLSMQSVEIDWSEIPALQDREDEDSSDDEDDDDDNNDYDSNNNDDNENNNKINNMKTILCNDNIYDSENESENDSIKIAACTPMPRLDTSNIKHCPKIVVETINDGDDDSESVVPALICRIDNDDSTCSNDESIPHLKELQQQDRTQAVPTSIEIQSESDSEIDEDDDESLCNYLDNDLQNTENFILDKLDDDEASPIGGRMDEPKLPGMIRISGCNPNGIKTNQLHSHIQHSLDLNIDIQCYAEVNRNFLRTDIRQSFFEGTKSMDRSARSTWGTSQLPLDSEYKPGGTAIISTGKTAGRVKQSGSDPLGRWTYQLLDGQGTKDILIVSVYQCCKSPTNPKGSTAYRQQEVLLSEMDRTDRDPRRNFYRDLTKFVKSYTTRKDIAVTPILIGDWNEECKGTSSSQKICNEFGLVNIFDRLYPNQKQFKTYKRGSRCIDFALTTPELADRVTNFVYEPFLYRLKGDHRAFYFDISEKTLFGDIKEPAFDPAGRSFSSKDRKATTKYLTAVDKHLKANNVLKRIRKLLTSDESDHREAEKLDREMTQACTHGEKQCRRRRLDYWSIEIHETKRNLSIWCQFRARRKKPHLKSTALIARTTELGLNLIEDMPIEEIENQITILREAVKTIHKESAERRDDMLLQLANFADDMEDKKKATALRQMKKCEKKTRVYRRMNFQRGRYNKGGGITRLQVPVSWPTCEEYNESIEYELEDPKTISQTDNNMWKEVNCPKEIEFLIRLRNQRHFGQAETDGTPFTTTAMKHKFNWNASTEEAELVLEGDYTDNDISDISQLMLDNMKRITAVDDQTPYVTQKEFAGKFRVWRESTSTSPSGRHLGHYKALVTTIDRSLKEKEREKYRSIQDELIECYVGLINYSIKHKYSLVRWKNIVNMMIYKEEGNVKIHRLRVIHLYEADLGFLWGAKWGKAMKKAVKTKTLHQGQYGGLPGRDCTSLTYLEEIRLDYSLITRFSFANFDNDATACYDRILCSIASLAGRKYGIHKDVIFVHAQTLEEAEFKLKTSTKISETSYRHCIKFPIHGTGQGSTNSPIIWCFISSVLFESHNKRAHGMKFESPDGEYVVRFNMVGFVDDSTCITGGNKNDTIQELLAKMKDDAQLWHDLLWCSGGKLELSKCGYHVIHFDFDDNGIPHMRHSPGDSILLQNDQGNDVKIKSKNIFQPRKNLGHLKSPSQSAITQAIAIEKTATGLTDAVDRCGGTRSEVRMLYESVWKPAVEYVIPQSFLSEKQLSKIERASMPKLIAKCGFNRNTSRAVLAGPIELGGGGFTPLKVTAGTGYVNHFLKNWRSNTEDIGKQLRILYIWTVLQAGVSFPLLEQPEQELDYVKGKVIPATRKYLKEIDAKIHLDNTFIRPILRANDKCIMDNVIKMELTAIQRERINCVRMYLGVMYISEICNTAGTSIRPGIDDGTHDTTLYHTTLTKPNQTRPNSGSWKLWQDAINTFTHDGTTLIIPLGEFTRNHSKYGRWNSYVLNTNQEIVYRYRFNENESHDYWEEYERFGTELRLQNEIDINDFDPINGTPTSTNELSNGCVYGGINENTHTVLTRPQQKSEISWDEVLALQPKWIQDLLAYIHFYTTSEGTPLTLTKVIEAHTKHGYILQVSDGSVMTHNMSFGWVIATPEGDRLIGAKGPCRGRGNSLRAEGAGMLSATMFLSLITKYLKIEPLTVVCISDNAELIRRCKAHQHYKDPFPNETMRSEFDVTEQIYKSITESKTKATYRWVKGHQDNDTAYMDLPLEAQLNVDADELAGEYQQDDGKYLPLVNMMPSCPAMLTIRGISITSNYRKQLIRAYVEPEYMQYLQYRFEWSDSTITSIAWKSFQIAVQRMRRDVLITKVCNDLLPTAEALYKRKYQTHDNCVLCQQKETRNHIIRCTSPSRIKMRTKVLGALRRRLDYLETEFAITETLCTVIAEWFETETVDITKYPIRFHAALKSQETIGWRHLFAGRISQEWLILQENSTTTTKIRKRHSSVWGASIVEILLSQFIKLWELRNEEVHGKTEEQQEKTRKMKLSIEVKRLNEMRDIARPSDVCLFHDDIEKYIEQSTAKTIAIFISSHRRAIVNSVKKYADKSLQGATSIINWVRGDNNNNDAAIDRIHTKQRNTLLHRRKEIERPERQSRSRQTTIAGYYTLNNID